MDKPTQPTTYADLGVSHGKEAVHAATKNLDKGLFPGAFCQIQPDLALSEDYCMIIHADGAGTKSSLGYVLWRETGDLKHLKGLAQDSIAMNIDDMVCVGATGPYVMSNTIGRNAKTFPDEAMGAIIDGYSDTVEKLHDYGIHIRMAGGETADVGDLVRTAIVDSTFITRMRRDEVIDCSQVKPGHVIIGFASDGQASYEKFENSGMGSNGLTAARHLILKHASGMGERLAEKYPESYAPEIREKAYQGFYGVSDAFMATNPPITIAEAILSPTRIYAPVMKQVIEACRPAISAIFHNTGGGQAKCLKFGNGVSYDKLDPLPMAPLFQLLQRETQYPPEEMARTFNLGSRMEVICDEAAASEVLGIASAFNIKAKVIGEVTKFTQGERRLQLGGHWEKTLKLTAKCD